MFLSSYLLLPRDVLAALPDLPAESVDAVVTDPPYELGFMGKSWDRTGIANSVPMWTEVLRVLKPGGHLLSFGGTRTYHRMACAIEDAGFEIRDQIMWITGQGFPKSLNVSKAITKADYPAHLAKSWEGWGSALKPSHEPIVVARKPLEGTLVSNVLSYGTGAINIDACRVPSEPVPINKLESWSGFGQEKRPEYTQTINNEGRWPSNIIHDGSEDVLDQFPQSNGQSGNLRSSESPKTTLGRLSAMREVAEMKARVEENKSAARFFYCAKTTKHDREEGCESLPNGNNHPTIKPTELMRYLVRLVTPPEGIVLDPFMGSGSTGKAALLEGFKFIGIEKEQEFAAIARARLIHTLEKLKHNKGEDSL